MEQDPLQYAVAWAKLLPDDLRNELSKLQLFSKFEAAPSAYKALLDHEPFGDSSTFFWFYVRSNKNRKEQGWRVTSRRL
jgi:hypothetical protein